MPGRSALFVDEHLKAHGLKLLLEFPGLGRRGLVGGVEKQDLAVKGRDGRREDDAVVVVVLLDGRGQGAGYADAVAAHNHVLLLSVLIEIGAVHGLGVLGAELEEMADLNALGELKPASAVRADYHLPGRGADRGNP